MSGSKPASADSLAVAREVDALCDRYEAALRRGEAGALDAWLPADGPARAVALVELVRLDLEHRRRAGEAATPEEYLRRFPELRDDPAALSMMRGAAAANALPAGAAPPADARTVAHTAAALAPRAVVQIPGYEVLGKLGEGGMGVVYKARHTRLNRVVALKMILAGGHAGEADLARFKAEAEAVARLQHPNIVQIFEVGEHGGLPFFSLEFCGGGGLDMKLNGTPLPPGEAAALVETLARAVHAAHEQHVVHRDLKPANVLLSADGTPKIADFGLAKQLDAPGRTETGAVLGTPSYMAPEQAGGKTRDAGPASDVYALGAILYECLTGRPPFKAATVIDTIRQVVTDEPVSPRRLQPKTPRDLETVCLKCLNKQPGRRYATALELARDLRHCRNNEPIEARPPGRWERFRLWSVRPQRVADAGAGLNFFTVVLMAYSMLSTTAKALGRPPGDWADARGWLWLGEIAAVSGAILLPMLAVGWGTIRRQLPALYAGILLAVADLVYSAAGLVGFQYDPYGMLTTRDQAIDLYALFVVMSVVWLAVYLIALKAYYANAARMRER